HKLLVVTCNFRKTKAMALLRLYRCKDEVNPPKKGYKYTNQPLKDLGMKFTPVQEYLYEAVKSLLLI
uniref:Uncharacterized protein n=1 Tax=Aegilops tauschii subsp. strangulata TaxID=200361 RepID=A0A453NIG6_AEGTS